MTRHVWASLAGGPPVQMDIPEQVDITFRDAERKPWVFGPLHDRCMMLQPGTSNAAPHHEAIIRHERSIIILEPPRSGGPG